MSGWRVTIALVAISVVGYWFAASGASRSVEDQNPSLDAVAGAKRGMSPLLTEEPQETVEHSARDVVPSSDKNLVSANCDSTNQDCGDDDSTSEAARIAKSAQEKYLQDLLSQALVSDPRTGSLVNATEAERLQVFDQFNVEPIDSAWSAKITNSLNVGIESAARIGRDIAPESIDCRSTTCMVRFPTDSDEDEVALLTRIAMFTGSAGLITRSEIHRSDRYADVYLTDIESITKP